MKTSFVTYRSWAFDWHTTYIQLCKELVYWQVENQMIWCRNVIIYKLCFEQFIELHWHKFKFGEDFGCLFCYICVCIKSCKYIYFFQHKRKLTNIKNNSWNRSCDNFSMQWEIVSKIQVFTINTLLRPLFTLLLINILAFLITHIF